MEPTGQQNNVAASSVSPNLPSAANGIAAPAQSVHQAVTSAPQSIAPTAPVAPTPVTSSSSWASVTSRAKTTARVAAVVLFVLSIAALAYFFFIRPRTFKKAANQGIASVEIPASQLEKLSSDSINVASDRVLTFNAPIIAKQDLTVKGQTTLSDLKITGQLILPTTAANSTLAGTTTFQGDVTAKGSIAVGGNLNTSGSGAFGGNLSANQLSVKSAQLGTVTIGHVQTSGTLPATSPGPGLGSGGSIHISGNDTAGTITMNTGSGAHAGDFASVIFKSGYTSTPHVVVSPVGIESAGGQYYVTRSVTQFSIGFKTIDPSSQSYTFDYFVTQ